MYSINAVIDISIVRRKCTTFGENEVKNVHSGGEDSSQPVGTIFSAGSVIHTVKMLHTPWGAPI
jgi:hypothetical protein